MSSSSIFLQFVIPNLFRDNKLPSRVMLKQVQHDEVLGFGTNRSLLWTFGTLGELKNMSPKEPKDQRVSGGLMA